MASTIDDLYSTSLTLRLLCARNAPMILGFFHAAFKESEMLSVGEEELELLLEKHLTSRPDISSDDNVFFSPNMIIDADDGFSGNRVRNYLNLWCSETCRYLRKVFSEERQCYVYQLTRHSEKALQWLGELSSGARIGHTTTESRFSRIFNELQSLSSQTNPNPNTRIKELLSQRDALDEEIKSIRATGQVPRLENIKIKDRIIDLTQMIEVFLSDFRAIEDSFKEQAAEIHAIHLERQRSKGDIVEHVLDADESLRNSEQGRSYFGFRALIRDPDERDKLSHALKTAAALASESELDARVFDNLMGRLLDQTSIVHGSFHKISAQLRRIVEESSSQDSRILLEWISEIKRQARALRDSSALPEMNIDAFVEIETGIAWNNLMELGFHEKKAPVVFSPIGSSCDDDDDTAEVKAALKKIGKPLDLDSYRERVARLLEQHDQIALAQVVSQHPLQNGAADLVAYLCVAAERERSVIEEAEFEEIDLNRPAQPRFATISRIIYQR